MCVCVCVCVCACVVVVDRGRAGRFCTDVGLGMRSDVCSTNGSDMKRVSARGPGRKLLYKPYLWRDASANLQTS